MNIKELDRIFSIYIRRVDAAHNGGVKCCTCPVCLHWKHMDAGHFISRKHLNTRWNEINCHAQCPECNRLNHGEEIKYKQFLINEYGENVPDMLRGESRIVVKFIQSEIDELTDQYKQKLKALDNQNNQYI